MTEGYPPAPAPPAAQIEATDPPQPSALRPVVVLLLINLGLSALLTVLVILARHSVISYQLDHRHVTDPDQRRVLRESYTVSLWGRVIGNVVASIVYAFLVQALLRGRRWAYRRVLWLGGLGIFGLLAVQATPYPLWMRAEQLSQALVLAALLYFTLRPEVRSHFAKGLPGRDVRRGRRSR
ncbi:MAG: hypothetical protein ABI418_06520 [Jatrophihabitantaceae bacterium]